ncbi:MAG: SDR family oxidoreductase [Acidobacteria bacterium]|nr:SDR family oxidoreductase [Acidobacteriota bacterium]
MGAVIGAGAMTALLNWRRRARRMDFRGKTVLITGGSRGLGLVLAREFAAAGARIAICARDLEELERARIDLERRGAEVFDAVCDVRNPDEVAELIEDVCARFGRLDVLVNNAGVIQVGPLEEQTAADFENALAVHFWGPYYAMRAAIPKMKRAGGGRIVNVASIGGKIAVPHLAPYSASKFALVGLSDALRAELRKDNIFVTTVCPGLMRTGSHLNALFKGQNELEFAWFSLGDALPPTSVSAEKAAREIVAAARAGRAEAIISVPARLGAKINALFPELTADLAALANRLLPGPGGIGEDTARGLESTSSVSPSFLTTLIDRAAVRNNELEPLEN